MTWPTTSQTVWTITAGLLLIASQLVASETGKSKAIRFPETNQKSNQEDHPDKSGEEDPWIYNYPPFANVREAKSLDNDIDDEDIDNEIEDELEIVAKGVVGIQEPDLSTDEEVKVRKERAPSRNTINVQKDNRLRVGVFPKSPVYSPAIPTPRPAPETYFLPQASEINLYYHHVDDYGNLEPKYKGLKELPKFTYVGFVNKKPTKTYSPGFSSPHQTASHFANPELNSHAQASSPHLDSYSPKPAQNTYAPQLHPTPSPHVPQSYLPPISHVPQSHPAPSLHISKLNPGSYVPKPNPSSSPYIPQSHPAPSPHVPFSSLGSHSYAPSFPHTFSSHPVVLEPQPDYYVYDHETSTAHPHYEDVRGALPLNKPTILEIPVETSYRFAPQKPLFSPPGSLSTYSRPHPQTIVSSLPRIKPSKSSYSKPSPKPQTVRVTYPKPKFRPVVFPEPDPHDVITSYRTLIPDSRLKTKPVYDNFGVWIPSQNPWKLVSKKRAKRLDKSEADEKNDQESLDE